MKLLIAGGTSVIAHEAAKCFAAEGGEFFLVGRNAEKLASVQADLKVRGAKIAETLVSDLNNLAGHEQIVSNAISSLGGLDVAFIAYGTLGDQRKCEETFSETLRELMNNCLSQISLLTVMANYFEKERKGCIAVITSVAGDRGRKSNYVYGTAKGALTLFLQGLRSRLYKAGVGVTTLKLGMVDTPMTAKFKKNFLFAQPDQVGKEIHAAITQGKDVAYIPWFWHYIMLFLRHIPEFIFKRLNF